MRRMVESAIIIILLNISAGCRPREVQNTNPTLSTTGVITQGTPSSARALEHRAAEVAKQWRRDAYLTRAHVVVSASRPDGSFTIRGRVTFVFRSKADMQHSYLVGFDAKGAFDVFEFSDTVPQSDDLPIESSDWVLDSIDAWRIALANGGAELLERYQQETIDMRCGLSLSRWDPPRTGRALWHVSCLDGATDKSFGFWIDAATGEVIEKQVN